MSTCYFSEKVGNKIEIGCGTRSIGSVWIGVEGQSCSPLSLEEAEMIGELIVTFLNKRHPITEEMEEEYGNSVGSIKHMRKINSMAEAVSQDLDDDSDKSCAVASSLLKAILED